MIRKLKQIISALLVVALLFTLAGCQNAQKDAIATQPTEATEPVLDGAEIYNDARVALEAMETVSLDVKQVLTTTVDGCQIVNETEQVMTYSGYTTDSPVIMLEETVTESLDAAGVFGETRDFYRETYADGKLYVDFGGAAFVGDMDADAQTGRYVPLALLDAEDFQQLSVEETSSGMTVSFTAPTEAEFWGLPEQAQLLDASGSAAINAEGALTQMNYSLTYAHGPVEATLEVESKPRELTRAVAVPENTDRFTPMENVEVLKLTVDSNNKLRNTSIARVNRTESITCEAAGVAYEANSKVEIYGLTGDLKTKVETLTYIAEASSGAFASNRVETYNEGVYVIQVDDGVPTTQSGVDQEDIRDYCKLQLSMNVADPSFWRSATVEDLGSTYLIEYAYTEEAGNNLQNAACVLLFGDATVLNNAASAYTNDEVAGYLAIDKYTGFVTASGLSFAGKHTIQGRDYLLSMELNQAVEMPAYGVYKAITGNDQAEEEPEEKAAPLFYHVTGQDGQEMWLLGTIHVGDERTAYLPYEIYEAFDSADALALEMDQELFEQQLQEDEKLMEKASRAYYYTDGSTTQDHLLEELYTTALKYMKASGSYESGILYMKPSLWQSVIENFYLQQGHELRPEQGVENRLTQRAKEQDKPIREIESGLEQLKVLTDWSDTLQQVMLAETLSYDVEEYWAQMMELYELWCAGDEESLRQLLTSEDDLSQLTMGLMPEVEEYNKTMMYDRNETMFDAAVDYLESGEVIFYAVGLAHLLDGENGLLVALREAGYTVEQVVCYQ